jgi:solute carrier family 44 (choline transporter-like protein), member 2/4/5
MGEKVEHDDLRDGPIKDRSCTDILCGLLFFAFVGAMVTLGVFGVRNGNPNNIIYQYDSAQNQCGLPGSPTESYPFLYYPNFEEFGGNFSHKVCVKECPNNDNGLLLECHNNGCTNCPTDDKVYNTTSFLGVVCVPTADDLREKYFANSSFETFGSDIVHCAYVVLAVLGIAVVVSIFYLILLRYFIGVLVWLVISSLIILALLTGFYFNYLIYTKNYTTNNQLYLYWLFAIIAYALGILLFVAVCCLKKRIDLAVVVMKSATIFIKDLWSILLVPVFMFFVTLATISFWVAAIVYLYSSGTVTFQEQPDYPNCYSTTIQVNRTLKNAMWFELFGIVWVNSFQVALLQFIISYACAVWYFTADKSHLDRPIKRGIINGLFYHLGSLAFGSLILTFVILIKWFLTLLSKTHKDVINANPVTKCLCGCVLCFVNCFERFIKYLDKQAYIRIALTGESFCPAAMHAFEMIWENAGRFTALGGVGFLFDLLGRILITALSTYLGFIIITNVSTYRDKISDPPYGPALVFAIASYVVASLFMGVYDISADTIIQAFIIDEKIHGVNSAVYAPEPIKEYMEEHGHDGTNGKDGKAS